MIVPFDFETRSKADLKKVGRYVYARHPSTEVICYAHIPSGTKPVGHELLRATNKSLDPTLARHVMSGGKISAWNAEDRKSVV